MRAALPRVPSVSSVSSVERTESGRRVCEAGVNRHLSVSREVVDWMESPGVEERLALLRITTVGLITYTERTTVLGRSLARPWTHSRLSSVGSSLPSR